MTENIKQEIVKDIAKVLNEIFEDFKREYIHPIYDKVVLGDIKLINRNKYEIFENIADISDYFRTVTEEYGIADYTDISREIEYVLDYFEMCDHIVNGTMVEDLYLENIHVSLNTIKEFYDYYINSKDQNYYKYHENPDDAFSKLEPIVRFYNRLTIDHYYNVYLTGRSGCKDKWYWFFNPFDSNWYISNDVNFSSYINSDIPPEDNYGVLSCYDEDEDETFVVKPYSDFSNPLHWCKGKVLVYNSFSIYRDKNNGRSYIANNDELTFSKCVNEYSKKPIDIKEIEREFYYEGKWYAVIVDINNDHYASIYEKPYLFRKIPYCPKPTRNDKIKRFYEYKK